MSEEIQASEDVSEYAILRAIDAAVDAIICQDEAYATHPASELLGESARNIAVSILETLMDMEGTAAFEVLREAIVITQEQAKRVGR